MTIDQDMAAMAAEMRSLKGEIAALVEREAAREKRLHPIQMICKWGGVGASVVAMIALAIDMAARLAATAPRAHDLLQPMALQFLMTAFLLAILAQAFSNR